MKRLRASDDHLDAGETKTLTNAKKNAYFRLNYNKRRVTGRSRPKTPQEGGRERKMTITKPKKCNSSSANGETGVEQNENKSILFSGGLVCCGATFP